MESARDIARICLIGGNLLKKGPTGTWKRRVFYLTSSKWMYFDSVASSSPSSNIPLSDIQSVQPGVSDHSGSIFIVNSRKKSYTLKAQNLEERQRWLDLFAKLVAPVSPLIELDEKEIGKLIQHMKAAIGVITSKNGCCSDGKSIVEWISSYKKLDHSTVLSLVASLVRCGHLLPLEGNSIENPNMLYKFGNMNSDMEKDGKIITNITESFGGANFDPNAYAVVYFTEHSFDEADEHCNELIHRKQLSGDEMKRRVCDNYLSFIEASTGIRSMENNVEELKHLIEGCKESITTMQFLSFSHQEDNVVNVIDPVEDDWFHEAAYEIAVHSFSQKYTHVMKTIEKVRKRMSENDSKTEKFAGLCEAINTEIELFSERLIKQLEMKDLSAYDSTWFNQGISYLIRLDKINRAIEICLKRYDLGLKEAISLVPTSGNTLKYSTEMCETFMNTMVLFTKEFDSLFKANDDISLKAFQNWQLTELCRFSNVISLQFFGSCCCVDAVSKIEEMEDYLTTTSQCIQYVFHSFKKLKKMTTQDEILFMEGFVPNLQLFLDQYFFFSKSEEVKELLTKMTFTHIIQIIVRDPSILKVLVNFTSEDGEGVHSGVLKFCQILETSHTSGDSILLGQRRNQ